jgi:UDP-glucose 4-epimerase
MPAVSFEAGVAAMLGDLEQWRSAPLWTPDSIATATKTWFQYLSATS